MSELVATRQAFGEELLKIMQENDQVMALTADLGESLRMLDIQKEFPDRYIDTGVAESNMVGIAAGLAIQGLTPVAGTFSVFMTRAFDHIRMQVCQNNLNVVLVGSHGGVSNALDGGSANALEDLAYMRALPNMTILYPADANEARAAMQAAVKHDGPVFVRLYREPTPIIENSREFKIGKAQVLRESDGAKVSIVACGPQVAFSLEAAKRLSDEGIESEVINVHTLQPLDSETIVNSAIKTGLVVTVEDHNINGGLGSAVAEVLGEMEVNAKLKRIAVEQFGESGTYQELTAKLGIDVEGIINTIKRLV